MPPFVKLSLRLQTNAPRLLIAKAKARLKAKPSRIQGHKRLHKLLKGHRKLPRKGRPRNNAVKLPPLPLHQGLAQPRRPRNKLLHLHLNAMQHLANPNKSLSNAEILISNPPLHLSVTNPLVNLNRGRISKLMYLGVANPLPMVANAQAVQVVEAVLLVANSLKLRLNLHNPLCHKLKCQPYLLNR